MNYIDAVKETVKGIEQMLLNNENNIITASGNDENDNARAAIGIKFIRLEIDGQTNWIAETKLRIPLGTAKDSWPE